MALSDLIGSRPEISLIPLVMAYLLANFRYLKLSSHQDAGIHAYWARFRNQGVTLDRQINVLMGCARLGVKFLYLILFALFRDADPDRLTRKVALVLTPVFALVLFLTIRHFSPGLTTDALAVSAMYLLAASIPTLGFPYETTERWSTYINILFFAFALMIIAAPPSPPAFAGLVFLMFMAALLFKITQLFEYLPIWIVAFAHHPLPGAFGGSAAGGVAAVAAFALLIRALGIMKAENLGILGYVSGKRRNPRPSDAPQTRDAATLQDSLPRTASSRLDALVHAVARRVSRDTAVRLYQAALNFHQSVPFVVRSCRSLIILAIAGAVFADGPPRDIALAWLLGALAGMIAQGRFTPLHFVPAAVPAAILAGFGLSALLSGADVDPTWRWAFAAAAALAAVLDLRFLAGLERVQPFDVRFWPPAMRPIVALNRVVREVADYLVGNSNEEDYVFVWGTLPQLFVISGRRSPINWLTTNENLIAPILPDWWALTLRRLRETRPKYLFRVDDGLDFEALERETGLHYDLVREFGEPRYGLFKLVEPA